MKTYNIIPLLFFLYTQFAIFPIDKDTGKKLATEKISLNIRHENSYINAVFKDNVLLNLAYLRGYVTKKEDINWEDVNKPFSYKFILNPKQTFAFHEDTLPAYINAVSKTTNADFNFADGFKSDGYLTGDGVCHLASLIYWVAKNANLDAYAPTNHNFAQIPQVPKEFSVSIYKNPYNSSANAIQNLYITNNKENAIIFEFEYKNDELKLSIFEVNTKII